jgi:hypothetical protein
MIEELKYTLLGTYNDNILSFIQTNNSLKFTYYNLIIESIENKIIVYYDSDEIMGQKLEYLNKKNTLKIFTKVSSAINYVKYLLKVVTDSQFELYHYFLFKLKEIKLTYDSLFFMISDSGAIRCDVSDLMLNGNILKYNFIFIITKDSSFELKFHPKKPIWNEGKICPKKNIDEIIDYIMYLNTLHYDEITLKEQ